MPIRKKSSSKKKKTSAKKSPAKKKTVAKRKKSTPKKRTSIKRKSPSKLKANAGKIRIEVTKGGKVDGGPKYVWSIQLKGLNGESIPAGLVTASTKTEALNKGKRIIKNI